MTTQSLDIQVYFGHHVIILGLVSSLQTMQVVIEMRNRETKVKTVTSHLGKDDEIIRRRVSVNNRMTSFVMKAGCRQ